VTTPDGRGVPTDDTELIAASLAEPTRFAELFDRHFPAIHRYLRRRVGPELADDLAAETFTQAFGQRHRYRPKYPDAAAWLYGTAANLLRQHSRAEQRRLRAYARLTPDINGPDVDERVAERVDASTAARARREPSPIFPPSSVRCCSCSPGPASTLPGSPRR
jgi:DNA-directed RNA polymerase specialized sigma24 family protein